MIGPTQAWTRVPHSMKVKSTGWEITLHPHVGDDVVCKPERNLSDAFKNAQAEIDKRWPGKQV